MNKPPPPADTELLERIFHEPNRLAIMSAICAAPEGIRFGDLKAQCGLTDGNLNRHLKVLDEAGVIRVEKAFVAARPRTTLHLSRTGLKRFQEYLAALAAVIKSAQAALPATSRDRKPVPFGRTATP